MKRLDNTGFSVVEGLLILVIVGILGFTGWYVWHVQQNTKKLSDETVNQSRPVPKAAAPTYTLDKAKGVIDYKNTVGKFSVSYPSNWGHMDFSDKLCGTTIQRVLEVGPDEKSIARCGTDGAISQVSIQSTPGDYTMQKNYLLFTDKSHDGWVNVIKSTVAVDGVKGMFYRGTAMRQGAGLGAFPDGAEVYQDVFVKNNITYLAMYTQFPKSSNEGPTQDQGAAFNKILVSLKFE